MLLNCALGTQEMDQWLYVVELSSIPAYEIL